MKIKNVNFSFQVCKAVALVQSLGISRFKIITLNEDENYNGSTVMKFHAENLYE